MTLMKNVKKSTKVFPLFSFVVLASVSLSALSGSASNVLVHDTPSSQVLGYRVVDARSASVVKAGDLLPDALLSSPSSRSLLSAEKDTETVVIPENIEPIPETISDLLAASHNQAAPLSLSQACRSVDCAATSLPRSGGLALKKEEMIGKIMERFSVARPRAKEIVMVAHQEAARSGMDPVMLLSIIATESSFDPAAFNRSGATGLMQAIPRYHHDKMRRLGIQSSQLTDIRSNIRLGAEILKEYLHLSNGNMTTALQKYNGNTKDPRRRYSNKVFQHYRWLSAS